jgi:hypothetical protein
MMHDMLLAKSGLQNSYSKSWVFYVEKNNGKEDDQ